MPLHATRRRRAPPPEGRVSPATTITMSAPAIPLDEFDEEMASTRRLLERVPTDRADWKPHPKSFSLGDLARLVASMPAWIASTLREPAIDLGAPGDAGAGYGQPIDALVETFDRNVREARLALEAVTGDALAAEWQLRTGDQVLLALPRDAAVRQHLRHFAHHRGQLTVYARLLDVPVPSIYGPTADERWG